jgi:hypothetical protein
MHLYEKTIYAQNSEEILIISPIKKVDNICFVSCKFFPVIPIILKFDKKTGVIQFIPTIQNDLNINIKYLEKNRQIIENINIVVQPNNNILPFSCYDKKENNDYIEYCKFMHNEKHIYYELLEKDNNAVEIDNDVKNTNSTKYMSLYYS